MKPHLDISFYEDWRLTSPFSILFIAIKRFRRVVRSVVELVLLGGLTVVILRFLDIGVVTSLFWYSILVLVFVGVSAMISYLTLRISISEDGIAMKSGVFRRSHKDIPWEHVRSVNLESGLIERLLKLTSVSIDTASSAKAEITIPAVPLYVGNYLKSHDRNIVLTDEEETISSGIDDSVYADPGKDPTLHSLSGRNMLIASVCAKGIVVATVLGLGLVIGIVSNGLWIFFALNTAERTAPVNTTLTEEVQDHLTEEIDSLFSMSSLFKDFWEMRSDQVEWFTRMTGTERIKFLGVMFGLPTLIFVPSLIIGFLIKAVAFLLSHKDYQLRREGLKLVNERGLVTRRATTVDISKVQVLKIILNVRTRLFGRFDVLVQQSDEDTIAQSVKGNTAHLIDIPCVDLSFLRRFAKTVLSTNSQFPPLDPRSRDFQRFSRTYFFLGLVHINISLLVLGWCFFWFMSGVWFATMVISVLLPVASLVWWQRWRRTGYVFNEDFVAIRNGLSGYELQVLPIEKLQEVTISQSIIQRFRNRCSLQVIAHSTTHSNRLTIPFLDLHFAGRIRDYLLYRIESGVVRWC